MACPKFRRPSLSLERYNYAPNTKFSMQIFKFYFDSYMSKLWTGCPKLGHFFYNFEKVASPTFIHAAHIWS